MPSASAQESVVPSLHGLARGLGPRKLPAPPVLCVLSRVASVQVRRSLHPNVLMVMRRSESVGLVSEAVAGGWAALRSRPAALCAAAPTALAQGHAGRPLSASFGRRPYQDHLLDEGECVFAFDTKSAMVNRADRRSDVRRLAWTSRDAGVYLGTVEIRLRSFFGLLVRLASRRVCEVDERQGLGHARPVNAELADT